MDIEKSISKQEAKAELKRLGGKLKDESVDSFLSLRHIDKVYPNGVQAVFDFCLDADKHDFVALVGPSGCGKSTTLRMIAGLEDITSGELFIDKVYSNYLPSKDRDIAMVFQNYALYPQMNVFDNIAFGLRIRHFKKEEIEEWVYKAADILGLGPYLDRKPKELSGGQMQRVALGRAIVRQSNLFLMDEPLSNLDAKLRVQMRSEIVRIHKEVGATTVYVTHDQTEAMTMANKIVVMNKGVVQQIGTASEVYLHPANLFVATFIGSPAMNILQAEVKGDEITIPGFEAFKVEGIGGKVRNCFALHLEETKRLLEKEKLSKADVARLQSSGVYKKNEKAEKPKKASFIDRFKSIWQKKEDPFVEIELKARESLKEEAGEIESALKGNKFKLLLGIRPESFLEGRSKVMPNFEGTPTLTEVLGSESIVHLPVSGQDISIKLPMAKGGEGKRQERVCVHFKADEMHLFDPYGGASII